MLSAYVQNRLAPYLFAIPTKNTAVMPLFSIVDLPFVTLMPVRSLRWMRDFSIYRRRLKIRDYASLAGVYPRTHLCCYLYLVFAWGRCCRVLPTVLRQPQRALIAEIFIRFICQMDDYIDSFDSRTLLQHSPQTIRRMPQVRAIADELCQRTAALNLPAGNKRAILRTVVRYCNSYLRAICHAAQIGSTGMAAVIEDKERVAGDLWRAWADLLGYLYDIPRETAAQASDIFFDMGMAIQVIDDISDAPADHKVASQNLFLAILGQHPAEWAAFTEFRDARPAARFMNWGWMRQHLPCAYAESTALLQVYCGRLAEDTLNPPVTKDLYGVIERIRRLGG